MTNLNTLLPDDVLHKALDCLIDCYADGEERARAVLVAALGPLLAENARLREELTRSFDVVMPEGYRAMSVRLPAAPLVSPPAVKQACPCLHTTPCDPRCTCVQAHSSRGCQRCCTYGSPEQQRARAEYLAALVSPPGERTWQSMDTVPTDGRWFWVKRKTGLISAFRYDCGQRPDGSMGGTRDCPWFAGFGWYNPGHMDSFEGWAEMAAQPPSPVEATLLAPPANEDARMAEFNVNDRVWVRLQPRGLEAIAADPLQAACHRHRKEVDGWTEWQLWDLMATLGHLCYMGPIPPFHSIIRLSPPVLAAEAPADTPRTCEALVEFLHHYDDFECRCGDVFDTWAEFAEHVETTHEPAPRSEP